MAGLASSLVIGFLLAFSSVWLVSWLHDRYIKREKALSQLLLKRAKKD